MKERSKSRYTLLPPAIVLVACADRSCVPAQADERQLLALHQVALKEHADCGFESLLARQSARFMILSSGRLSTRAGQGGSRTHGDNPGSTRLAAFRYRGEPDVKVSGSGHLGWVVAQIEAWGTYISASGKSEPVAYVLAWIELYEHRGTHWAPIGALS